jgi:thioredoxin 1
MVKDVVGALELPRGITIVDFSAEWCAPCKALYPILKELSEKHKEITFLKVDISTQLEMAKKYQVMNVPCLVAFKDGVEVDRMVGFGSRSSVESLVLKFL